MQDRADALRRDLTVETRLSHACRTNQRMAELVRQQSTPITASAPDSPQKINGSKDRRRKVISKGITATERRDLLRADGFARVIRKPLDTTLDFQPKYLTAYPTEPLDVFFQSLRTRLTTWQGRKKVGAFWVWTRENYEGDRREHLHMVLHLPQGHRAELEAHVRRLFPGGPKLISVGERKNERDTETGRWVDGLRYRMKQLRGDAVGAPGPTRLNQEPLGWLPRGFGLRKAMRRLGHPQLQGREHGRPAGISGDRHPH